MHIARYRVIGSEKIRRLEKKHVLTAHCIQTNELVCSLHARHIIVVYLFGYVQR